MKRVKIFDVRFNEEILFATRREDGRIGRKLYASEVEATLGALYFG